MKNLQFKEEQIPFKSRFAIRVKSLTLLVAAFLISCADPLAPSRDPMREFESLRNDVAPEDRPQRVQNVRSANLSTMVIGDTETRDQAQSFIFTEGELSEVIVHASLRAGPDITYDLELQQGPVGMELITEETANGRAHRVVWAPPARTISEGHRVQQLADVRIQIVPRVKDPEKNRLPAIFEMVEHVHIFPLFVISDRETSKPSISVRGWPSVATIDLSEEDQAKDLIVQIEVNDHAANNLRTERARNTQAEPALIVRDIVDSTEEVQRVNGAAGIVFSQSRAQFNQSARTWTFTRVVSPKRIWTEYQNQVRNDRLHVQLVFSAKSAVDNGVSDPVVLGITLIKTPRPEPEPTEEIEGEGT